MLHSKSHDQETQQRIYLNNIYDAQNLANVFPKITLLPSSALFPRTFGVFLKSNMTKYI